MAGDFREFFDKKFFNEQRLGEVEFILTSPAYIHTFKPYLQGIVNGLNALWKDRSQERKDKYPDDFLAGGITLAEGLMEFFAVVIDESKMERIHAAMENITNEQLYDLAVKRGAVKPVVGINQQVLPQAPEEDAEEY